MFKGSLFTREFLIDGIRGYDDWRNLQSRDLDEFQGKLKDIFAKFPTTGNPLESTTKDDLIKPVIEALGWRSYLTEQTPSQKGRKDVPDFLLFPDSQSKQKANKEKQQADRYQHGLSILEAKAWGLPLDRKSKNQASNGGVPSNQILRYLSRADVQSNGEGVSEVK